MSNGINKFEIQLDNPTETYSPGQTVSGKLIIELDRTKKLRALKLRFEGECRVHWQETAGQYRGSANHHGTDRYFRDDIYVYGEENNDTIEMTSGYREFLFSFILPQKIPSSFEHSVGKIDYTITAIFDRPWKIDYRVKKIIKIITPIKLEPSCFENIGINDETSVNYCCLLPCFKTAKMLVNFQIPKTMVARGDNIHAIINIKNKPNTLNITSITMAIEQKFVFKATDYGVEKKTESTSIAKAEKLGPFKRNDEVKLEFQVPLDVLPSSYFDYCALVDMSYNLRIKVQVSGCHAATVKNYEVYIKPSSEESVSLQQTLSPLATNNSPSPDDHQDSGIIHAYLVPPSNNSNQFDLPLYRIPRASSSKKIEI